MEKMHILATFLTVYIGIIFYVLLGSAAAQEHYSDIAGYSTLPLGTTNTSFDLGGPGIGYVEYGFHTEDTDINNTFYSNTVRALSSANLGTTGGYLSYHIEVPSGTSATGPGSTIDNYFGDYIYIEPSESYSDFAPINFVASLNGTVSLLGNPSGGAYVGAIVTYWYNNESGYTFKKFQYNLPAEYQYPPVYIGVDEEWSDSDMVQVGSPIRMEVIFTMDLNGSGHNEGASVTNYLDFYDSLHAGIIAGAEGVGEIWSLASVDDDIDGDGYTNASDCNEYNVNINPGATEICDGLDNDCDGATDEDPSELCSDGNICSDGKCVKAPRPMPWINLLLLND